MNIQPQNQSNREYLHTLRAGAFLPFMQATFMALVITIVIWLIAAFVFNAMDPYKPAILLGSIAWAVMLFRLFSHWLNLTTVETLIQRDINGDGVIGQTAPAPVTEPAPRVVRIRLDTISADQHYQSNTITFPCDDDQLQALAKGLISGLPFSEKFWTGKGKPFSVNMFREVRDVMKTHDLCEYVNDADPRQGIRLTATGRALMEKIASPTPPQADEED